MSKKEEKNQVVHIKESEERKIDDRTRILCIGCGTGQAQLLFGLKDYDYYLSSIVGITDNGGHSGLLKRLLGIPSVGDARNCLSSLTGYENAMAKLLKYRFTDASLGGISMGNLMLAVLTLQEGKFSRAINMIRKSIGIPSRIIPVSDESTEICALLEDEKVVIGEWGIIDRMPKTPIKKMFHKDSIALHPLAKEEIEKADYIVFAPGSIRTGIISILLTKGIKQALEYSKAKKIYVCNIMTQPSQSDKFTLADYVNELLKYLNCSIDYILFNKGKPTARLLSIYEKEEYRLIKKGKPTGIKTISADLVENIPSKEITAKITEYNNITRCGIKKSLHLIRHDPLKTASEIIKIIEKDLKTKNKG